MPPMFVLRGEGISKEEAIESLKTKYMKVICDVLDKTMFISGRLKDVKLSQFVKSDLGSIYSMSILFTNHASCMISICSHDVTKTSLEKSKSLEVQTPL